MFEEEQDKTTKIVLGDTGVDLNSWEDQTKEDCLAKGAWWQILEKRPKPTSNNEDIKDWEKKNDFAYGIIWKTINKANRSLVPKECKDAGELLQLMKTNNDVKDSPARFSKIMNIFLAAFRGGSDFNSLLEVTEKTSNLFTELDSTIPDGYTLIKFLKDLQISLNIHSLQSSNKEEWRSLVPSINALGDALTLEELKRLLRTAHLQHQTMSEAANLVLTRSAGLAHKVEVQKEEFKCLYHPNATSHPTEKC
jgi:hypothetical protein